MNMVELSDVQWAAVHELRLRGLVKLQLESVAVHVEALEQLGVVVVRAQHVSLSDAGRQHHAAWASLAIDTPGYVAAARLHDSFHELNVSLLTICTAWQVRSDGSPNDHTDAKYDWDVIDQLQALHDRTAPRIRRVARDVARFDGYDRRLRSALKKVVDDGDHQWFASPRVDSYHTVWNHFHEDLLLALGRRREDEPQP